MPSFNAIAAMSENRVIGDHGKIPWHLPEDFRWFKHKTMGGTLIMGRKTFESIGRPLPGRKTLVLSRDAISIPGVQVWADADALIRKISEEAESRLVGKRIRTIEPEKPREYGTPWICGGAQIYQRFLPECMNLYLTRVKSTVQGDAYFPPFEENFSLHQTIHETDAFRVERWVRKGWTMYVGHESWPFPDGQN